MNMSELNKIKDLTLIIIQSTLACELIHAHLTRVNRVISRLLIIKKVMLLNISIQEDTRIQMRCR